jgi:hypothetical protein
MRRTDWGLLAVFALCVIIAVLCAAAPLDARARKKAPAPDEIEVNSTESVPPVLPNAQQRVHRVSDVQVCMTNWGFMGSQVRDLHESRGGCFNPNPGLEVAAPSFEYPPGSGIEYLFQGAMWIGAVVNDNIYTSVGCDGWFWIYELWPDAGDAGAIMERSTEPNVACYSPDAVSGQDVIAAYYDTSADIPLSPDNWDEWDNRKHHPLGVKVTQKSYSWDSEGLDKFIIVEYAIHNIGAHPLSSMYVGFYMDADIMHVDENPYGPYGAQDDITGFLRWYDVPGFGTQEVDIAWAADNDGSNMQPTFSDRSPRGALGMKVLRTPNPDPQISYNWWVSNISGYPGDWGPWKSSSQVVWAVMNPYAPGNSVFPDGVLGTPGGDVSKYFIMSNGEIDYDQIYACVWPDDHPDEGWLPHSPICSDLATGYDVRFLLSFGPFDQMAPGDSLAFAVAYIMGEDLHVNPSNLLVDPNMTDPDRFYSNLDFTDLVVTALRAESLYCEVLYNRPPNAFSLLFPPNKAFAPRRVRFDWEDAVDPDASDWVKYDLYLSTSYHFPFESTWIRPDLPESECTWKLDDGAYFWKVKAKDRRGAETWSSQMRKLVVTGIPHSSLGDFNMDGLIDLGDVVFAINYIYKSGPASNPLELGDTDCDGRVDIGDVVLLLSYLFKNGAPLSCP